MLTGTSEYVDTYEILVPTPAEEKFYSGGGAIASLKTELPLETADDILSYKPEAVVHQIAPRPLLIIGAELDYLTGFEECVSLYEKAREPKQLHILPGISHYETYSQGFDTVVRLSVMFQASHGLARTCIMLIRRFVEFGLFTLFGFHDRQDEVQYYRDTLDLMVRLGKLGFDSVWGGEEHFYSFGLCPGPQLFLTAVARETSRIRLGTISLPFEILCAKLKLRMLDILSNGSQFRSGARYYSQAFRGILC